MSQSAKLLSLDKRRDFAFKLEGDTKLYRLPLMQYLPLKTVRQLSAINKIEGEEERNLAMVDLILDIFDKYTPGLTDKITQADMLTIFEAWNDASSAKLPE